MNRIVYGASRPDLPRVLLGLASIALPLIISAMTVASRLHCERAAQSSVSCTASRYSVEGTYERTFDATSTELEIGWWPNDCCARVRVVDAKRDAPERIFELTSGGGREKFVTRADAEAAKAAFDRFLASADQRELTLWFRPGAFWFFCVLSSGFGVLFGVLFLRSAWARSRGVIIEVARDRVTFGDRELLAADIVELAIEAGELFPDLTLKRTGHRLVFVTKEGARVPVCGHFLPGPNAAHEAVRAELLAAMQRSPNRA